jgi:hypothetical protein
MLKSLPESRFSTIDRNGIFIHLKRYKHSSDVSVSISRITQMKVKIWSDVMCPFCYIGKRRFENALKDFPNSSEIEIEWKSFLLNPAIRTDPGKNINQYLSKQKAGHSNRLSKPTIM